MRQLLVAAAAAFALAACGQGGSGTDLPRVQQGARAPSTQTPPQGQTQQAQVTEETRQSLTEGIGRYLTMSQGQQAAGSQQVGSDTIIPMQPSTDHRFVIDLSAGQQYGFLGACDDDCSNVDIEVISMETGGVVADDMSPSDFPFVRYQPQANGQYMVRLLMQACTTAPCFAGVRVVSNGGGGGGGAPAATGGGTPGKP